MNKFTEINQRASFRAIIYIIFLVLLSGCGFLSEGKVEYEKYKALLEEYEKYKVLHEEYRDKYQSANQELESIKKRYDELKGNNEELRENIEKASREPEPNLDENSQREALLELIWKDE